MEINKVKKYFLFFFIIQFFNFESLNANEWLIGNKAVFQGLDKITARIKTFNINVGEKVRFGVLNIKLDKCVYSKPTKMPESIAFIKISDETKRKLTVDKKNIIFKGWIFASSPALNALEHPVYDLTLIACK